MDRRSFLAGTIGMAAAIPSVSIAMPAIIESRVIRFPEELK